jgi:serine/threonine-protein kinase
MRVIRGGSWMAVPMLSRCAGRFAARPHERFGWIGMRLVRSVVAPAAPMVQGAL